MDQSTPNPDLVAEANHRTATIGQLHRILARHVQPLTLIVCEILTNAMKYAHPAGGVPVRLTVTCESRNHGAFGILAMSRLAAILRRLSLWLFWPGVILIVWGELTPSPPDLGAVFGWDKLEHFTAYFGLTSMATMVLKPGPRLTLTTLDIVLLSGLLELLQSFTGRDPEIMDFVANGIGALSGFAAGALVWRLSAALD